MDDRLLTTGEAAALVDRSRRTTHRVAKAAAEAGDPVVEVTATGYRAPASWWRQQFAGRRPGRPSK